MNVLVYLVPMALGLGLAGTVRLSVGSEGRPIQRHGWGSTENSLG